MSAASTSAAPSAAQLFSKVSSWVNTSLNPELMPKSKKNPFVKVIQDIASIPKNKIISEPDARAGLRAFFISMPDEIITTLPDELISGIESILATELANSELADADQLVQEFADKAKSATDGKNSSPYPIAVWRGDMGKLKCGAMVNPANGALLGCFLPSHKCLDNILHAQAGPRLRVECAKLKEKQGIEWDDNGQCRVTGAEQLPAQYVFHTCGPDLNEGRGYDRYVRDPTPTDRKELASSYITCIQTASELKCPSVAFCCISTGIFGYPSDEAVGIAMKTTKEQLDELAKKDKFVPKIVFNTFLEKDFNLYMEAYESFFLNSKFEVATAAAASSGEGEKKEKEEETTEKKGEESKEKKNENDDAAAQQQEEKKKE